ncbi:MAG: DUF4886 domain-containing protein [Clostridia bacterium]|nr:DUF4886 domain-containing protein [Clostridia bacterium]
MKKILSISNSFGVDATRYLYGIARAAKENIKIVTLYIGGCSLYRHYRNMLSEEAVYDYYIDGINSGLKVSLKTALLSDEWDVVTLQESSPRSGNAETYFPYITELSAYVKRHAPEAEQYMHMTWSFSETSPRFALTPYANREEMIPKIREAYEGAAKAVGITKFIPSLDAMCKLYDTVGEETYRDGFHCSLGISRYTLACVWFMTLCGKDIEGNSFRDFDVEVSEEHVALAQKIAKEVVLENGYSID